MDSSFVARPYPSGQDYSIQGMASTSHEIVTTLFVSNLHCNSCVHTIKEALSTLSPPPIAVDVSIITQTITLHHSRHLSTSSIEKAIDQVGFDLVATPADPKHYSPFSGNLILTPIPPKQREKHIEHCTQCQLELDNELAATNIYRPRTGRDTLVSSYALPNNSAPSQALPLCDTRGFHNVTLSIGGMTCASCSNTIARRLGDLHGTSNIAVNLIGNSATLIVDDPDHVTSVVEVITDLGYEVEVLGVAPVTQVRDVDEPSAENVKSFRVALSIGGMTCASCVNTIVDLASAISGVSDLVVNLIGKSALATVTHRDLAEQLVRAIEDAGYEAELAFIDPIVSQETRAQESRVLDLCVEGMFCLHCPAKVMSLLKSLGPNITVLKQITSHTDPILRVSYTPSPPSFTVRTIIDTISSSNPFTATIHHPPSLEDRARYFQRHEQYALLWRLSFSVVIAIPTFIIGVVYMSLIPSSNETKMWWMRPIWAGNASRMEWALFFLATPVMFYSAGTFHRRSLKEIWALWNKRSRVPIWRRFMRFGSMNLLVSSGVSVAYFASIALLALAAAQDPSHHGEGDVTTYFDSVVFLTMFLLAGRYLEAYSKGHTADAINALGKLRPTTALLVDSISCSNSTSLVTTTSLSDLEKQASDQDDAEKGLPISPSQKRFLSRVSTDLLEVGDTVRVQHGASPPADGTLVRILADDSEPASFDESSLTGESRPVRKSIGDKVYVGTINRGVVVDVRVDAVGGATMLDQVVEVVREGQTRRAPIERIADLLTGYFVPVVTLLAIVTWVIWLALGLSGALPQDYLDTEVGGWAVWSLEFAIAVFVVACPCGIGLAAPTALLVGSGLAAKYGILVRGGGEAFQEAAQLDLVVFDKTGTLTEGGDPRVTDFELMADLHSQWSPDLVLGIAAELESTSSHPLAVAIRSYCLSHGATSFTCSSLEETPGRGLKGVFDLPRVTGIIGNEAWMVQHGAHIDGRAQRLLDAWKSEGKSVALLALTNIKDEFVICSVFAISDPLRVEARSIVLKLQDQGLGTWMISGDNRVTAEAVARMVGIPETNVIADVLPHEKAQKVRWLQQVGMKRAHKGWRRLIGARRLNERCVVAMVGDGINDAPALSTADVGIAIGSGSDVAISSASFILVSSDLESLLILVDLSRTVFNRVKINFLWASIYNIIALPIAAGVVYPAHNHPRLAPVWASLAMALSSVSVVCSSLALKLYKKPLASRQDSNQG